MIDSLKAIPFFSDLSDVDLQAIASKAMKQSFPVGQVIFEEGQEGGQMYLVITGRVQVIRKGEVIALLKAGDFFGEMSLVSDEPRNATVRSIDPCDCYTLSKNDFKLLMESNRQIASKVSYEIVKRSNQIF